MNYIIRKKEKDDCFKVQHVVTIAWNETYKGIVSDEFLKNLYLNEEERSINSYNNFNEKENHQYVLEVDNNIVGFINVGSTEETDYDNCGEIHALYIINKYQGYGFGKKLIEEGIKELKTMGFDKMIIGCLEGNSSNEFYKHIGGKYIKQRIFEMYIILIKYRLEDNFMKIPKILFREMSLEEKIK